jgi:DNA-binding GntR family transcriptional regulator
MPSTTIAELLRMKPGMPVWEIRRRRLMGGQPVILETARIPLQVAPTIDEKWLSQGKSLYGMLATTYGLFDQYEEQTLQVVAPTADERRLLNLSTSAQVVSVRGVSYTEDGAPFDCFEQTYAAEQFAFFVSGSQKKHLLPAHHVGDWFATPLG